MIFLMERTMSDRIKNAALTVLSAPLFPLAWIFSLIDFSRTAREALTLRRALHRP